MGIETPTFNPERKIARRREELPPLREGYVRAVHLTSVTAAEKIAESGLAYRGDLSSTARSWSNEKDVEFASKDRRFRGAAIVAVVMDIPVDEHRQHHDVTRSPGLVPPEYVVGIIRTEVQDVTEGQ